MKYLHLIFFCAYLSTIFSQSSETSSYSKQLAIIKERLSASSSSSFSKQLQTELTESVFPFWYGTPWDYNGHTNKPRQGVVACGYFVSTTLKHIGFNLNRYDIAKMYSSDIVKVLCHDDYQTYYNFESFQNYCSKLEDGIYILGLSNHVGFLSIEQGTRYFIHSDYSSEEGVRKEVIKHSFALENASSFWVGNFSNHSNTQKWYRSKVEYLLLE